MTDNDRFLSPSARHLATLERVPSLPTNVGREVAFEISVETTLRGATLGSGPSRATFPFMDMHGVAEAAALGIAAGIRSTVPLAALGLTLPRRRLYGAPLALASAGELVYDKLPQAGARTEPISLTARIVSGAIAGGVAARVLDASIALGASTGAVAALASTFLFRRVRAEAARRVPALVAAISGDLLAIGTSAAATRRLRRAR